MHIRARSALVAAFALFPASTAVSQARSYFTPQDALDIVSASVGDLSDDGRWLAVSTSVRRDSYGQDYRRDGDPTYVRGVPVRLVVIDTRSGATQAVFPDKRPVRSPNWSPDGKFVEIVEIPNHPWFIAVQFHPEFRSKPLTPHPLFASFVEASYKHKQQRLSRLAPGAAATTA